MQSGHWHDNLDWYLAIFTKCYYKGRQLISLQSAITCYYKVRQLNLLQSATTCYYKVRQLFYYKVRQVLLQSATGITKCDSFITKWDRYYKVRWLLQSATEHMSIYPLCSLYFREIVELKVVEEKDFGPSKWCHVEVFSGSRKRVKW